MTSSVTRSVSERRLFKLCSYLTSLQGVLTSLVVECILCCEAGLYSWAISVGLKPLILAWRTYYFHLFPSSSLGISCLSPKMDHENWEWQARVGGLISRELLVEHVPARHWVFGFLLLSPLPESGARGLRISPILGICS